ncbi:MAG: hypothetical protein M1812_006909 [Candelaria pacifica]|nr:MAG: hypothetical protein M1812_006909 [Candelaria pacifica]
MAAIEHAMPPELLLDIFSRLSTQDVKSTRLVCKRFNQLSSSYLLERVYFALRPKTFDVFVEITKHPVFSRCIKEIIFDASYFDGNLTSVEQYRRAYLSMPKHPATNVDDYSFGDHGRNKDVPVGFEEYCSLFAAQEQLKVDDTYRHSLQQGLTHLHKLESVIYSDWRTISRWIQMVSSAWDYKSTTGPASWYLQAGPMRWDVKDALWPSDIRDAMQDKVVFLSLDTSVIPLRNLLRAVSDARVEVRKIGGFSSDENATDVRPQALPPCIGGWNLFERIGPNLSTLEMAFYTKAGNQEHSTLVQRLEGLMQAAPNLSTITLRFRSGTYVRTSIPVPDNVLSSSSSFKLCKWPKLRSFRLLGFDHAIQGQELEEFLDRHKYSLRELGLEAIELVGCRWHDLMIRISVNLSLEAVTLAFLYDPRRGPALFDDHSTGRCLGLEQIFLTSKVNAIRHC